MTCLWLIFDFVLTWSWYVHDLFMALIMAAHVLFVDHFVYDLLIACLWHLFMTCSWFVCCLLMVCSRLSCPELFITCSWLVHTCYDFFTAYDLHMTYDLLMTCSLLDMTSSWLITYPWLAQTCSWIVHSFFIICPSQLVHNFSWHAHEFKTVSSSLKVVQLGTEISLIISVTPTHPGKYIWATSRLPRKVWHHLLCGL